MIQSERDRVILSQLKRQEVVSVRQLYSQLSDVSTVTVRRDIVRLAEEGRLLRVRGGIRRLESKAIQTRQAMALGDKVASNIASNLELADGGDLKSLREVDVVILPPVDPKVSQTIYRRTKKAGVLCLDESSLDGEGIYLGVDNKQVGIELGRQAGKDFCSHKGDLHCLVLSQQHLANTRNRASGFLQGLRESVDGEVRSINVDAGGVYKEAARLAQDALDAFADIDLIFAINDQSALAAIDAARASGKSNIAAYCIGGEGGRIFDELAKDEILRGLGAMFPHVVARNAIDAINRFYAGEGPGDSVITPHRLLSPDNYLDFYCCRSNEWSLREEVIDQLAPPLARASVKPQSHSVLFIQHYPSHHWYKTLSAELSRYCDELGFSYHTASLNSQFEDELRRTRREIAQHASHMVESGDTIVLSAGECSRYMAEALCSLELDALTVITNSLPILEALEGAQHIQVMLTGGTYQPASRNLVGPSVAATLENIRIAQVFLSADGLSMDFGVSCADERDAKVLAHFSQHSRETIVLADHSQIDEDANFRGVAISGVDSVVSDFGMTMHQRIAYSSHGVSVQIAGDGTWGEAEDSEAEPAEGEV